MKIEEIKQCVSEINKIVTSELWFDLELNYYRKNLIQLIGSIDLTYGYTLSIDFNEVFFVSMPVDWKTNTQNGFLFLLEGEELKEISLKFKIEIGFYVFKFMTEDQVCVYISSKEISFINKKRDFE